MTGTTVEKIEIQYVRPNAVEKTKMVVCFGGRWYCQSQVWNHLQDWKKNSQVRIYYLYVLQIVILRFIIKKNCLPQKRM